MVIQSKTLPLLFLFSLHLFAFQTAAQDINLSSQEVNEDLTVFYTTLNEAHPGIDLYFDEAKLELACEQLFLPNDSTISILAFYRNLLFIVSELEDGHTDLQSGKRFYGATPKSNLLLPFKVDIIENQVYIRDNLSDDQDIIRYSELIEINNRPTADILKTLYALTPADGNNIHFKRAYNEVIFSRQLSKLIESSQYYDLILKTPDGEKTYAKRVLGISDAILYTENQKNPPLSFSLDAAENYAVLTINTFQYKLILDAGQDFNAFLDAAFRELNQKKSTI